MMITYFKSTLRKHAYLRHFLLPYFLKLFFPNRHNFINFFHTFFPFHISNFFLSAFHVMAGCFSLFLLSSRHMFLLLSFNGGVFYSVLAFFTPLISFSLFLWRGFSLFSYFLLATSLFFSLFMAGCFSLFLLCSRHRFLVHHFTSEYLYLIT